MQDKVRPVGVCVEEVYHDVDGGKRGGDFQFEGGCVIRGVVVEGLGSDVANWEEYTASNSTLWRVVVVVVMVGG